MAGRFRILGVVGVGGMGTVYRVKDEELDEIVALKMLRASLVATPVMADRFRREVRLARRVTHRHVARTFDIGEHGLQKFITMELIEGESLADILLREGALPPARVVALVRPICAGLSAAHAAGVVHRDLKPENVLVARDGRVVITDFGVAAARGSDEIPTIPGMTGTPAYMAPEQVIGTRADARADVYAMGAIVFELATGRLPFEAQNALDVAVARLKQPPPDAHQLRPEVPPALAQVIQKAMARRAEDRYPSIGELQTALDGAVPESAAAVISSPGLKSPASKAVAVLPFRGLAAEDAEHATAFTEDLVDCLSMARGVRVRRAPAAEDPREAGRRLEVALVVHGTFSTAGDRLRVSARLTSVEDGFQVWAQRLERGAAEGFALADETARLLASALTAPTLGPSALAADPVLLDLYRQARQEYQKLSPPATLEAVSLFEKASARAPEDPVVLSATAMALVRAWNFNSEQDELDSRAAAASMRAATYAPHRAEPHLALALLERLRGEWLPMARALREALLRDPDLAEAHEMLGVTLLELGEAELGAAQVDRAVRLDPQLYQARLDVARVRALLGDTVRAQALIAEVKAGGANTFWRSLASRMILWRGDREAARALLASYQGDPRSFLGRYILAELAGLGVGARSAADAEAVDRLATTGAARRRAFFQQIRAEVAGAEGRLEDALAAVAAGVDRGLIDRTWLDRCPPLGALRGDPRFAPLRQRVEARARELSEALEPLLRSRFA